jgi:arginine:pyruvate transaminase
MVPVPLRPENRFHLRPEDVAARVTPRTRAILINNPHNPTGASLTREEIEGLGEIARQYDIWLIADEVYAALNYERPHVSPLSVRGIEDRVAVVSSLSKSHAMTGWRAGWAIAPVELADYLEQLAGCMCFGSPTFIQDASVVSLTADIPELESMRDEYVRRATAVVRGLADAPGISCEMPEAGMFIFADVRGTGLDGLTFAHGLLDAEGVSLLPGAGFGSSSTGHVRISLAVDEDRLGEACRRISRYASSVADAATAAASRAGV